MKYELSNPSDKIFFDAASDEIATICALFLGNGMYAAKREGWSSGFYLMGICEEEINRLFKPNIDAFIKINRLEINEAFQSFRYDNKRTSMNQIVREAHNVIIEG